MCVFILTLWAQCFCQSALDPRLTNPIPRTAFANWREIDRQEFSITYEAPFDSPLNTADAVNNRVRLKVMIPTVRRGPIPVVILLHYWGATNWQVEESLGARLNEKGIAAVLMPLPYHLSRTPEQKRSGELAIQADPAALRETMTQSIMDIRRTIDWIEAKAEFDKSKIGISGTSLGSIVSGLAIAVEPRIMAASFTLGGIDLAHILWNSSAIVGQREGLRKQGFTEEKMRLALAPVEPMGTIRPGMGGKPLVIGARHDTVIPPSSTQKLIDALETPHAVWIETGHYGGVTVQNKLLRTITRYFDAVLHDRPYTAPGSVYAPTIRIGVLANGDTPIQVGAGLDIWRLDKNSTAFATAFLTPRGPQGFVGYRLSREFSLGAAVTRKKVTWGLSWSVVL